MLITRWRTRERKPNAAPLDGRSRDALIEEIRAFSRSVRFLDPDGREDGNWAAMLEGFESGRHGAMEPHLALLGAFAGLFRHSQEAFNAIPDRLADLGRRTVPCGADPVAGRLGAGGTARDLERLILDRFDAVDRVRILPARDASGRPHAGHLLVLAANKRAAAKGRPLPKRLREEIRAALASATSPLARIHVPEPAVLHIDLRVTAAFRGRRGPDRLGADLRRLLSPAGGQRLDLPDDCSLAALRDGITRYIHARPYVAAIAKVVVEAESASAVSVPAAGRIAVAAMSEEDS